MGQKAEEVADFLLSGPRMGLLSDRLMHPSSSFEAAAQKALGTYREELSCLASGQGLEEQLSIRQKGRQRSWFIELSLLADPDGCHI